MRPIIVGTKNSIRSYVNDNELSPQDVIWATTRAALEGLQGPGEVIITYGFKVLPSSVALGISDTLEAAGFTRDKWRYEA